MKRWARTIAAAMILTAVAPAARAEGGGWDLVCRDSGGRQHCDLAAVADIAVRGAARERPAVTVSWEATNAAHGLVESLTVSLDPDILANYDLVSAVDAAGRHLAVFSAAGEADGDALVGTLSAGETVALILVHVGSRHRVSARLSGDGFDRARQALLAELRLRQANFW